MEEGMEEIRLPMDPRIEESATVAMDEVAVPLWTVDLASRHVDRRAEAEAEPRAELAAAAEIGILAANRAALDLFRARSAADGRVLLPEARSALRGMVAALRAGQPTAAGQMELGTLAGDRIWVAVTCARGGACAAAGSPIAVVTFVDLTSARRWQGELEEERGRRLALLDGIPDLVFEIGPDGDYRGFAGRREAASMPPEEFLGRRIYDLALPEIARPALEAVERVRRSGTPETVEYSLQLGSEIRALEVRIAPASDGGAIAVVRDATERRLTEKRLQESELRFRTMADNAPVLLWMSATDGLCTFFNKGWLEFRGRTLEEEYGTSWAGGVHAEDFQRCMHVYMNSFVARQSFRMEYRLRRADGEYRWILDEGVPRYAPDGSFAGFIGSCIDITELRELQTRLDLRVRERTAELASTVQELEAFCYSVSHDLRAPLRAIDGFCHALLDDYGGLLDERGHDYLRRARAGASRMGELIDGLLKLSRIGRAALRQVELDLSGLARQVAIELERAYPDRRLRFSIQDGLVARGDPLLRTVLENLLENAVKFTIGSPEALVEFGATRQGGQLVYFVRDNGVGFNMEYSKRLFGAFQRLHTASDFPGTGVGLASVQRVIHRHGGRVWAEAAEGQGATFYWTLPESVGAAA